MAERLRFKPKYKKIIEALLYMAHVKPGTDHYAASKYVYLADKLHLNRYARPVTFDQYGAMPWGPVALNTYQLLKGEEPTLRAARVEALPFERYLVDKQIMIGAPFRAVNYDVFSQTDIEVLDEVLSEYGKLSGIALHNLTKEHFAYRKAWDHRPEGAKLAPMDYEDLIDEGDKKRRLIEDIGPISGRL